MALVIPANSRANHIARLTNNAPISGDYTCTFWAKRTSQRLTAYRVFWSAQNAAYDEWIGLFTDASVSADENVLLNSDDGGGVPVSTSSLFAEQDRWIPYAYVRTGNTHEFFMLGISIDDFTLDLTATTIDEQRLGGDDFSNNANCSGQFMLLREWDTALTLAELIAEWNSPTVIKTANLWSNCPLINNADDISGNARHYSAVGSVTYATSPTPVPLTNTTSGTAYDVTGSLPQEFVQVVRDATPDTKDNLWFKHTVEADIYSVGAFFYAGNPGTNPISGTTYAPYTLPYEASDLVNTYLGISLYYPDRPIEIPVTPLDEYYFQARTNNTSGIGSPAVLYFSLVAHTEVSFGAGDILINNDHTGFPGAILSSNDYEIKKLIPDLAAGEAGDAVSNGNILLEDVGFDFSADTELRLYDKNLNYLLTLPGTVTNRFYIIRTCRVPDVFYAATNQYKSPESYVRLRRILPDGTETFNILVTGVTRLDGIAVSNDETILYWVREDTANNALRRWDIGTQTSLSDLIAHQAGLGSCYDILITSDDEFLISYSNDYPTAASFRIHRYDSGGVLLSTYNLDAYIAADNPSGRPRIGYGLVDTTSFVVWIPDSIDGYFQNKMLEVRISDGVILQERNNVSFQSGINAAADSNNDLVYSATPVRFGPSGSCPIIVLRESATNSIQVIKVTVPSSSVQSFDYTTTGGLSPSTFSLAHGENIIFDDLANGTYGVTETEIAGWTTTYEVSNGDPHDAIVLSGGTNVIVTVTNTQTYRDRSGIYKIVPGKRNDTLWIEEGTSTEDVMIPNPYARFPFVGE